MCVCVFVHVCVCVFVFLVVFYGGGGVFKLVSMTVSKRAPLGRTSRSAAGRGKKKVQAGLKTEKMCNLFLSAGFIWLFSQYLSERSKYFASIWSCYGCSHAGSLFTDEEKKRLGTYFDTLPQVFCFVHDVAEKDFLAQNAF